MNINLDAIEARANRAHDAQKFVQLPPRIVVELVRLARLSQSETTGFGMVDTPERD